MPSHVSSEGGGGVVRKRPPSVLRFERGRVVVVCRLMFRARVVVLCRLTFRVREGVVWLGNSPSVSRFERGRVVVVVCRQGGVVRKRSPSVLRFE